MADEKLEPFAVHDPRTEPVHAEGKMRAIMKAAWTRIPPERRTPRMCGSRPASWRRNVLGAQPLAACAICERKVWVSPSSVAGLAETCFVCVLCMFAGTPAEAEIAEMARQETP